MPLCPNPDRYQSPMSHPQPVNMMPGADTYVSLAASRASLPTTEECFLASTQLSTAALVLQASLLSLIPYSVPGLIHHRTSMLPIHSSHAVNTTAKEAWKSSPSPPQASPTHRYPQPSHQLMPLHPPPSSPIKIVPPPLVPNFLASLPTAPASSSQTAMAASNGSSAMAILSFEGGTSTPTMPRRLLEPILHHF